MHALIRTKPYIVLITLGYRGDNHVSHGDELCLDAGRHHTQLIQAHAVYSNQHVTATCHDDRMCRTVFLTATDILKGIDDAVG